MNLNTFVILKLNGFLIKIKTCDFINGFIIGSNYTVNLELKYKN
jgi:hypothetical protein